VFYEHHKKFKTTPLTSELVSGLCFDFFYCFAIRQAHDWQLCLKTTNPAKVLAGLTLKLELLPVCRIEFCGFHPSSQRDYGGQVAFVETKNCTSHQITPPEKRGAGGSGLLGTGQAGRDFVILCFK
jgi:hypothetical protein